MQRRLYFRDPLLCAILVFLLGISLKAWKEGLVEQFAKKDNWEIEDLWGIFVRDLAEMWTLQPDWETVIRLVFISIVVSPQLYQVYLTVQSAFDSMNDMLLILLPRATDAEMLAARHLDDLVLFTLVNVTTEPQAGSKSWSGSFHLACNEPLSKHVRVRRLDSCTLEELCHGNKALVREVKKISTQLRYTQREDASPLLFMADQTHQTHVNNARQPFYSYAVNRLSKLCSPFWIHQADVEEETFFFTAVYEHFEHSDEFIRVMVFTKESLQAVYQLEQGSFSNCANPRWRTLTEVARTWREEWDSLGNKTPAVGRSGEFVCLVPWIALPVAVASGRK
jgi:hypothetical protein